MGQTKIEWADAVWNPVTGCTPVSEGCHNCYAKRMATRLRGRFGYPDSFSFRVTLHRWRLKDPLHWRKPRRIFVCSMGDLFHDYVPDEFIRAVFGIMALTPQHTYMVLTKRARRMQEFFRRLQADAANVPARGVRGVPYEDDRLNLTVMAALQSYGISARFQRTWPLHNVWLGVTAENQQRADERIPVLLQVPAAVRFVSVEPMLGPVDLWSRAYLERHWMPNDLNHSVPGLNWVICGGETGPGARPMELAWVRSIVDQCRCAGVPVFVKQLGACASDAENGIAGARLRVHPDAAGLVSYRLQDAKGADPDEWPEDVRIREMPEVNH